VSKRLIKDDVDRFHDYNLHAPSRTIYMGSEHYSDDGNEGGTDGLMAESFLKNIMILETVSKDPITIIMNNIGGDPNHGLAIYDAIKACKTVVTIKVFGNASSMGSIILQAAKKRIMSPNSVQLIHYGDLSLNNHAKVAYKYADENKRLDKWMEKMYLSKIQAKHPNYTMAELQKLLAHDTFLTAQESVRLGLADKILGV
jgi:ATP-dependent Clp protease, protease subunit